MIGLITKDFLVLNRKVNKFYKLLCAIVLVGIIVLLPENCAIYIGMLLPVVGVSFLAELIKVEEKSAWKDYLPTLPLTSREIVLSRYLFCGILLAALSIVSLISCMIAPLIGSFLWFYATKRLFPQKSLFGRQDDSYFCNFFKNVCIRSVTNSLFFMASSFSLLTHLYATASRVCKAMDPLSQFVTHKNSI